MEITIKISNIRELNRLKKLLKEEKINILVKKRRKNGKVKKVNRVTEETFRKTDRGEELVVCRNVDDLFKKLGI